ncbi:MAG TPA: glycosyltransferase family 4 protein [Chloroflexota bacterium]
MAGLRDLAVIHLTFEGIQTYGGGVATVTRGHIGALPMVKRELEQQGLRLTPYFAEIATLPEHERADPSYEQRAVREIHAMGGEVGFLVNYTRGMEPTSTWGVPALGELENWKAACASGAAVALNWARRHEMAVVFCHDSLFALAPLYATLQAAAFPAHVVAVYVVHSTALIHELPLPNPQRLMVESVGVHWPKIVDGARLGSISDFMSRHIVEEYGARPETIVPTGNGINPFDPMFRLRSREEIVAKLQSYGVPLDRPLIFSWGRPVPYKRYDVFLRAAARLKGRVHPVLAVFPDYPEMERLARDLGLAVTLVKAFDPEFVACMLQWEGTVAACSLAFQEPFGLTPAETRMHARKQGPLMVVSDTGGLVEQVVDGVDGFVTRQDDPDDVARVIVQILAMPPERKAEVRRAGLERVLRDYTWPVQMLRTLAALVPEVQRFEERVHQRLVQEALARV